MNTATYFRYYLALVLLGLLGLAIRVQNGATVKEQPTTAATPTVAKPSLPLLAQQ